LIACAGFVLAQREWVFTGRLKQARERKNLSQRRLGILIGIHQDSASARINQYEHGKHDGSIPIVGVNTFRNPDGDEAAHDVDLTRSDESEKQDQLRRVRAFQGSHSRERDRALVRLQEAALGGGNVFAELMGAVRCCSLGQITHALFEVGGRYRRNV